MAQRGPSGACGTGAPTLRACPAQPRVPKAGECNPRGAHLPPAAAHLFVCLHTHGAGVRCKLCLFVIFAGQQILIQLLKKAAADRVREQQCKLQGKTEEFRSPASYKDFQIGFSLHINMFGLFTNCINFWYSWRQRMAMKCFGDLEMITFRP